MPKTYYDSVLTGTQIEGALEAIHGVVTPSNNGKVLYIENGQIKAASASRWSGGAVLEPLNVTQNGDYTPPSGTDGFDSVHVAVPGATLTTKSITQNGTYNASSDNADGYSSVTVNVSGGGSAVVQPLSVTQNGTYTPPSGVDGYAPVTVNVSGGGGSRLPAEYQEVEYIQFTESQFSTVNQAISNNQYIIAVALWGRVASQYYPTIAGKDGTPTFEMYLDSSRALKAYGSATSYMKATSIAINTIAYFAAQISSNISKWFIGKYYESENGSSMMNGNIYRIQVSDTPALDYGNISLDFIPCYRKSDNKAGLYEIVNGDFYPSEGSSDYISGPDVN